MGDGDIMVGICVSERSEMGDLWSEQYSSYSIVEEIMVEIYKEIGRRCT